MKKIVLAITASLLAFAPHAMAQNSIKNLRTEVQNLQVEQLQNTEQKVQLHRYLFAGYNTLCLPMTISGEQLSQAVQNIKVERLAGIRQTGSDVELLFVDCTREGIQAGVPYLVFSPTRQYLRVLNTEVTAVSNDIKTIRVSDGQGNQVAFNSSWTARQKDGLYGVPANQNREVLESVLVRTTADKTFLPSRCGFSWEQQNATAERLTIVHVGSSEVTAISPAVKGSADAETVYDLNGRVVTTPAKKGIFIRNGKKTAY